jgi:hypothetical protein
LSQALPGGCSLGHLLVVRAERRPQKAAHLRFVLDEEHDRCGCTHGRHGR